MSLMSPFYGVIEARGANRLWHETFGQATTRLLPSTLAARARGTTARHRLETPCELSRLLDTAKAQGAGAVFGRADQQVLAMFGEFVGGGEIPSRSRRAVVSAAAERGCARVLILEFVRPLPDVSSHIHHAERARPFGKRIHWCRPTEIPPMLLPGSALVAPGVAPWVRAAIESLRGVLPFPLVRQPLAGPAGVGARVFQRNPGDGPVLPAGGILAVLPILEEIVVIRWMIVRGFEKIRKLPIGHRVLVDVERRDGKLEHVVAPRRILTGILHVHSYVIPAFDLDAVHLEVELR